MNLRTLLLRSLRHHWRSLLAVSLGAAVGTAVLTGSLIVGDSMRASLRNLTLERLGRVDHALVASRLFREQLAADLDAAPAIMLRGSAMTDNARAGRVNVLGVDDRFWKLASSPPATLPRDGEVLLNDTLAHELNAKAGDRVLLRFEKPSAVPRDSVMGRRSEVVATVPLTVAAVIPSRGVGRFGLQANQQLPRNAFVPLATLQRALKLAGRANALFVAGQSEPAALQARLRQSLTLADLDLQLRVHAARGCVSLESSRMILEPAVASAALAVAAELGIPAVPTLTYLANTIAIGGREIPYSTVTAFDFKSQIPNSKLQNPLGALLLTSGEPTPALGNDEVFLNEWAATDLATKRGDTVRLAYYTVDAQGQLHTAEHVFKLAGVVALSGAAADPTLTPEYPGISDAKTMADWNPPFPVDLKRVRAKDEDYWEEHRATPKAFVSLATGQRLWSSRFGNLTAIRLAPAGSAGVPSAEADLKKTAALFEKKLLAQLSPDQLGMVFQPVKEQGLRSSGGATDFGQLFFGFSFFLIISAAMLVALLFRLGVERRAKEIGILLATGFPVRVVRRLLLLEGGAIAVVGGALGLIGAVAYGALMIAGLRTWWLPAVGTPFLNLALTGNSLAAGGAGGVIVALASVWRTARSLRRREPVMLLAGRFAGEETPAAGVRAVRRRWFVAGVATVIAAAALVASSFGGAEQAAMGFLGSGAALLVATLAFVDGWFRRAPKSHTAGSETRPRRVVWLGVRNGARHPGRSVLTAGLVASATFLIMAVTAFHHAPGGGAPEKASGDGGFLLVAESDVPLHHDLNSPKGREALGVSSAAAAKLGGVGVTPFRLRPGDDTSCLNLYAPEKPRILGATDAMIGRGGFRFAATLAETAAEKANPWLLLRRDFGSGVVPVFGDANTVQWILHSGLGQDLVITDEHGATVRLRFVGLLSGSIFQSELVMAESRFLKLFPSQSGYGFFLIEAPVERGRQVSQLLAEALSDYGFNVTPTAERLASFAVVENTYLATFQMLGGLGLVLGTLGLGAILLRNVLERRGELALLRALGFPQRALAVLVLAENGFLLLTGLLCGVTCALLAVAPHLAANAGEMPWGQLIAMLVLVAAAGLGSSALAVRAAWRVPMLSALREE
ncbi:MAG: ABC transporter permease [Verrucomicrobia bacterium]|nr:ABC transporter permease [Verrucomicrobiota bacterium]